MWLRLLMRTGVHGMNQSQLGLPASKRNMMDANKHELLELDIVGPAADPPARVGGVLVHRQAFGLRHEALDAFGNIFC
jgi:hypothetical protein